MTLTDSARARRYLLGEADEEERTAIEQEYFAHEDAVDRIAAAEDDLIEDYLAGELSAAERDSFERGYLSTPRHRNRVETVRRLMTYSAASAASSSNDTTRAASSGRSLRYMPWLALAASLVVIAAGALWMLSPFRVTVPAVVDNRAIQPSAPATTTPSPAARIFALTVSPVGVRGSAEGPSGVIPAGVDTVSVRLESDGENRSLTARRATVRTVAGREVWQGPVSTTANPPGIVARIDVPAASLPVDDYLITLYGTDRAGKESEWAQYVLRVRTR